MFIRKYFIFYYIFDLQVQSNESLAKSCPLSQNVSTKHSLHHHLQPNTWPIQQRINANMHHHHGNYTHQKDKLKQQKRIVINCGGVRFECYKKLLDLIPESRLADLTGENSDYDPVKNEYFFDRDPNAFHAILNYYRTGKLHAPLDVCGNLFFEELVFWGISETRMQPCCWTIYNSKRECEEILKEVIGNSEDDHGIF
jgi:hypothetical protein